MIRSAMFRQWCALGAVLIPGLFIVTMMLGKWSLLAPASEIRVWCCMRAGGGCHGGEDAEQCVNDGALAFSSEKDLCAAACASALPLHGAPSSQ